MECLTSKIGRPLRKLLVLVVVSISDSTFLALVSVSVICKQIKEKLIVILIFQKWCSLHMVKLIFSGHN